MSRALNPSTSSPSAFISAQKGKISTRLYLGTLYVLTVGACLAGCAAQSAHISEASPAQASAAFSPGTDGQSAESLVLQAISVARTSIHIAAYSFTSKPIATALVEAEQRGVKVEIVVDQKANNRSYTEATFTAKQGVPTRTDGHYAIMHDKFMIIDGKEVETGSFNYTSAAAHHNAENALLLRDVPELAASYEREWRRLWDESESVSSSLQ